MTARRAPAARSSILIEPLHPCRLFSCAVGNPVRASYQAPQHFFHFLPLPQGQGSLRPISDFGE